MIHSPFWLDEKDQHANAVCVLFEISTTFMRLEIVVSPLCLNSHWRGDPTHTCFPSFLQCREQPRVAQPTQISFPVSSDAARSSITAKQRRKEQPLTLFSTAQGQRKAAKRSARLTHGHICSQSKSLFRHSLVGSFM